MSPKSPEGKAFYEFDPFRLEVQQRILLRNGELIPLAPKALDLILALVEAQGRVVSKEELIKRVWPDTIVEEGSLTQNISTLRKTLGQNDDGPQYIQTVSKRGYRFVAPLKPPEMLPERQFRDPVSIGNDQKPRDRHLAMFVRLASPGLVVAATLLAVALAVNVFHARKPPVKSIRSLAVMPFENLSHDPEQEYFADGMTDALITNLGKVGALHVLSRNSVMPYKGTKKPLSQILRELNVDAVVEGAVVRDPGAVRISMQLISGADEKNHLWAEQYEGSMSQVPAIQDSVAKAVANEIQVRVTPRESTLLAKRRAVDPAAYEAYLRGQYWVERKGDASLIKGRAYLEQAIEKDPAYAQAWAGLAEAYVGLADWGVIPYRDAFPRARAAAERALELDDSLVGPVVALAAAKLSYEWDWSTAEFLCKRAIGLNPNYGQAHHLYATYLAAVGRTREAVAEARRAREAEPLTPEFQANVVWKLYLAREYDEAELEARRIGVLYPGFSLGYVRASLYMQTARQREAVAVLKQTVAQWGRGSTELMYLAHGLGVTGTRTMGQQVLDEMLERERMSYVPPDHIAVAYEGLGQREQALRWYEKAFEERSINWWILPDPQLDSLRADPRFQGLLRKTGLPRQTSSDHLAP